MKIVILEIFSIQKNFLRIRFFEVRLKIGADSHKHII